ncbi:creatininase family protein [Acidobacteriota bacterium]
MKPLLRVILGLGLGFMVLTSVSLADEANNSYFKEEKIKNYLPHMTWLEVEEALKHTDMAIIPVGSIEQHGKHLPLCTDVYAAIETCKLIAQETDVLVAPATFAGISEHHMGFPGTMTLSPKTFEMVVFDTAQSLIRHGIRKICIYNGHGGNRTSVQNILHKINHTTLATAVLLSGISIPPDEGSQEESIPLDYHAGVNETSTMLYMAGSLVDMSKAEKPVLTFPADVQKMQARLKEEPNLQRVISARTFLSENIDKEGSTKDLSAIGVVTSGDPKDATAERGKKRIERFVKAAVKFIEAWKSEGRL